jgi:hypothetical protein
MLPDGKNIVTTFKIFNDLRALTMIYVNFYAK